MNRSAFNSNDTENHESTLEACRVGDLFTLQKLLSISTNKPIPEATGLSLLATGVQHQHPKIVTHLLTTHPTISLCQSTDIVASLLSKPSIPILRLLLAHDSHFANISIDYGMRTFLTDACREPPPKINPLIHVLLDTGADVNDGMGPGGGALLAAIWGDQGKDIILKIVKKGGFVAGPVLTAALQKERVDVLRMLLKRGGGNIDVEDILRRVRAGSNKRIEKIVERFMIEMDEVTDEEEFQKGGTRHI
ncbi:hypothetical protein ONS95_003447 [Cadophora gregata]|uniref:uncharacterized protein n=1 Tax=Cadophora gregata TaxID=51156 RepID=UPI0026DCB389|nr:uncharacterized protein ONS95_003447 [Cadophora gregata]KAK0108654.1 hypothetical protein ONS95_003447 [Cadophora gregata]KAK0108755.1 hypothetical protein ONS96_002600 [Cadophora gregata f. sp. sojae]